MYSAISLKVRPFMGLGCSRKNHVLFSLDPKMSELIWGVGDRINLNRQNKRIELIENRDTGSFEVRLRRMLDMLV